MKALLQKYFKELDRIMANRDFSERNSGKKKNKQEAEIYKKLKVLQIVIAIRLGYGERLGFKGNKKNLVSLLEQGKWNGLISGINNGNWDILKEEIKNLTSEELNGCDLSNKDALQLYDDLQGIFIRINSNLSDNWFWKLPIKEDLNMLPKNMEHFCTRYKMAEAADDKGSMKKLLENSKKVLKQNENLTKENKELTEKLNELESQIVMYDKEKAAFNQAIQIVFDFSNVDPQKLEQIKGQIKDKAPGLQLPVLATTTSTRNSGAKMITLADKFKKQYYQEKANSKLGNRESIIEKMRREKGSGKDWWKTVSATAEEKYIYHANSTVVFLPDAKFAAMIALVDFLNKYKPASNKTIASEDKNIYQTGMDMLKLLLQEYNEPYHELVQKLKTKALVEQEEIFQVLFEQFDTFSSTLADSASSYTDSCNAYRQFAVNFRNGWLFPQSIKFAKDFQELARKAGNVNNEVATQQLQLPKARATLG